jgi:hypothetical protein
MLRISRSLESLVLFTTYAKLFPDALYPADPALDAMLRQIVL